LQKVDKLIFIIVAILMAGGTIFSYSLPLYLETFKHLSLGEFHFVVRYIGFGSIGFILMILLSRLDPDKYFEKIGWILFGGSLIAILIMPFLPTSIAPVINGARRWISFGPIKFAPVEFFKIGLIFFLSWSFTRQVKDLHSIEEEFKLIVRYLAVIGVIWLVILVEQSDLGQVMVMGLIFAFLLLIAGGRYKVFLTILGGGIIIFILAIMSTDYRYARFKAWLSLFTQNFFPSLKVESQQSYEQVQNSLNAIYHGGVLGQNVGNGVFKLGFLSDVHTDFVLAGIAEEGGLAVISLIIILMLGLVYRIYRIANRVEKKEYQLFTFGIGTLIMLQFILNGLGITSLIPIKGLTVPFLSYGGSSLLALCIGIGMVLMISKKAKR
jgi:cell division protein FtsW